MWKHVADLFAPLLIYLDVLRLRTFCTSGPPRACRVVGNWFAPECVAGKGDLSRSALPAFGRRQGRGSQHGQYKKGLYQGSFLSNRCVGGVLPNPPI